MIPKAKQEATELLKVALKDLEDPKSSVSGAVQKLFRASDVVGDPDTRFWCGVQLGDVRYTGAYTEMVNIYSTTEAGKPEDLEKLNNAFAKLEALGLSRASLSHEEICLKMDEGGGAFKGVAFIEERYADLVRLKKGNDNTHYKNNLLTHLTFIRQGAHIRASRLYALIAYADAPQSSFDVLKIEVDDQLLDLDPELGERLMAAFKAVATNNSEEWSQALTSCRRLLEGVADALYPASEQGHKGRAVGKGNSINRLWAYMDRAIESESNRDLAKAHVDFLGSYLERVYKLTNKGVHTTVGRIEVVKAVFHTYLTIADLLSYLKRSSLDIKTVKNIHTATLDEIESLLGISRQLAKEFIKLRVEKATLTPEDLRSIKGVTPAIVNKAEKAFSFEVSSE